jgi:tetratricopeptide (TPR) repeat protein
VVAVCQFLASYAAEVHGNLQQVEALVEAGKWKEAELALARHMSGPAPLSAALFWKAYIEFKTERYAASAASARAYLQQEPTKSQARKILGLDLFMMGDVAAAQKELELAVEMLPGDTEAQYYLGRVYFTRQNMPAALAAFQRLLKSDPNSVRGHNHLGQTYEALNQMESAQAEYEIAISLDRSSVKRSEWPYYNLGVLHLKAGRAQIATDLLQEALQIQAQFSEARVKLATALAATDATVEASRILNDLLREHPDNADAHYQLARLYLKINEPQKAQVHFKRFEALRKK